MALQNHNLLIALGAARQAGATGAQFAMPVRILICEENIQNNPIRKCWLIWIVFFSVCLQAHFFDPHFLRTQQFADAGSDAHGDDNSNNSSLNRRREDDEDIDDDEDENDADSTNLPLNLVATQFAEWKPNQWPRVQWMPRQLTQSQPISH